MNDWVASRPRGMEQLQASAWGCHVKRVMQYLGYLYNYGGVAQPTLTHYLDPQGFVTFVAFLRERQCDVPCIYKAINTAARVVAYLAATTHCSPQQRGEAGQLKGWYESMASQLSRNMPRVVRERDPEVLAQQGKWMDAAQLVQLVEGVRLRACEAVAARAAGGEGAPSTLEAAGLVHDALFAMMFMGYLPPLRPSCAISTTCPQYKGKCLHPDCRRSPSLCAGNSVSRDRAGKWHLYWPHHKCSKHWGGDAIRVQLPEEMGQLLGHHCSWGHAALTRGMDSSGGGRCVTLFLNTSTGQPLKDTEVAPLFSKTVLQGTGCHFGAQRCRSIFVDSRRGADGGAPGPDGASAAAVMGHSLRVWDQAYDRRLRHRAAQQAVQGVGVWRQALLLGQQQGGDAPGAAAQSAAGGGQQQQQLLLLQAAPPAAAGEQHAVPGTSQQLIASAAAAPPQQQHAAEASPAPEPTSQQIEQWMAAAGYSAWPTKR
jgi:hypothetical protein